LNDSGRCRLMSYLDRSKQVVRKSFGKLKDIVPVPNLIEVQSKSFNDFVQLDYLPEERFPTGLEKVLRDIFPIDYEGKMSLEYVSYQLGDWACTCGKLTGIVNRYSWTCLACKASGCSRINEHMQCPKCKKDDVVRYRVCPACLTRVCLKLPMTVDECRSSGQTFALPLRITVQLIGWNVDVEGSRSVRDIKEQDIFLADIPVMADLYEDEGRYKLGDQGTFLINGVDRVVVSQLHRSPGVVFSQSKKASDLRGRPYYLARIIPMRGSWIDFEFDNNDLLYVRIDKRKKLLVTTFLQALGIPRDEIISKFYSSDAIYVEKDSFKKKLNDNLIGQRLEADMLPKSFEGFVGRRITKNLLKQLHEAKIDHLELKKNLLLNKVFSKDVVDTETGEVLAGQGEPFTEDHFDKFKKHEGLSFELIASYGYVFQPTIALTLAHDSCMTQDQALKELHYKVWPGDSASIKDILKRLETMLFSPRVYDLTKVGRLRMNRKLGLTVAEDITTLTIEDIIATVRYLVNMRERGEGELDDIDHLGNRRVRLVGELLSNQFYVGFSRIERIVRERFRVQDLNASLMPQDFLNVKPLAAVMREFFGTGQLSQFMDQTNPLSELAHKRRLSALGPGGVMKDRATYEIRDVHTSHYGRICPIETPEGQTIGLISSLATYAMVNDLGFIETAYRPVKGGKLLDEVIFLDAFQESDKYIAQADAVDKTGNKIEKDTVLARYQGNFLYTDLDNITYIDLSPKQLVSVASALIPFLEHDDASRALMGANMQRQAVPLIRCQTPLVGTGMEKEVCKASPGAVISARHAGVVEYVSSEKIIVRADEASFTTTDAWLAGGVDVYHLRKFERSSYSTWIHQKPIVSVGDRIEKGQILTDGTAITNGELALGSNLLVAFMPWHGYNFEDAIVLNKRLVAEDVMTSVHIDEYIAEARDTKLGPEEITRDIPNVSEKALSALDEDGVVLIGSRVRPGDILVGKVTLKGDVQYSPEEKLLRAIFGEKSREVRDTSLRVPPGIDGTVVDVKVFSRSGIRKDRRYKDVVTAQTAKFDSEHEKQLRILGEMVSDRAIALMKKQGPAAKIGAKLLKNKKTFDVDALRELAPEKLLALKTDDETTNDKLNRLLQTYETQLSILENLRKERISSLKKGDPLPSGVIKMIKVYVASKRHVQVGDKMAGRHGNKGVVSTVVQRENMPYLDDGRTVDVVLNPIGVPSRMNVGQILETILGFAGIQAGRQLRELIEEKRMDQAISQLEKWYGKSFMKEYEEAYGKRAILELAERTAEKGLSFATPVFDGASFDEDISPLLKELNLTQSGAYVVRDGRTGEYFEQPVTIGSIYMMKLNHMVDDKLHARSVGPYSLVTQQPLGGKAQFGGQRFGEMEVWALEAYGAAYTLQEMLTYKSDDVTGRHRVYETIVRGDGKEIPDPGLPESFNVLIKELQSLALQVDLFKGSREEISE